MHVSRSPDLWDPLTWWGHAWRVLAAAAMGFALFGLVLDPTISPRAPEGTYIRDLVIGLVTLVVLPLHRRFPITVSVLLQAATAVSTIATGPASVALVSIATRRRWGPILLNVVVAEVAYLYGKTVYPEMNPMPVAVDLGVSVAVLAATVGWGLYLGARRDLIATWRRRAENADVEQARRVAAAQADERSRIAREMHDVLAHRISLVSMHAGALAYRTDLTPEEVRDEAAIIQRTSAEALAELRGILGVLRGTTVGGTEASTEAPQPTYVDLPRLVQDAGPRVALVDELPAGAVPPTAVGRHVYRMVQEALTNVRKHAPGAASTVHLRGAPGDHLVVEITNDRPARLAPPSPPGSGLGLVGLAERATIVGGTLDHGPTPHGGYRVVARLPWSQEAR